MAISTQLQQLLRVLLPDKGFKTAGHHRDAIIAGVEESKTYTDEKAAEAVKKTGNETIEGVKTFTSAPVVPDATLPQHPVTLAQGVLKTEMDAKADHGYTGEETVKTVKEVDASVVQIENIKLDKSAVKQTIGPDTESVISQNAITNQVFKTDVHNVRAYGAVGDGVTDDSLAIQAAINAGNRTYIPRGAAGIYVIDQSLLIPSNHTLEIDNGVILKSKAGLNAPIIRNADYVAGNDNIKIIGGLLDGNKTNQTVSHAIVHFEKLTNSTLEKVTAKDIFNFVSGDWGAIRFYDCAYCDILYCNCFNAAHEGLEVWDSHHMRVIGGTYQNQGNSGVGINRSPYSIVMGVQSVDNASSGITVNGNTVQIIGNYVKGNLWGINVGHTSTAGDPVNRGDNVVVIGNIATENSLIGINIQTDAAENVILSGNNSFNNPTNYVADATRTAINRFFNKLAFGSFIPGADIQFDTHTGTIPDFTKMVLNGIRSLRWLDGSGNANYGAYVRGDASGNLILGKRHTSVDSDMIKLSSGLIEIFANVTFISSLFRMSATGKIPFGAFTPSANIQFDLHTGVMPDYTKIAINGARTIRFLNAVGNSNYGGYISGDNDGNGIKIGTRNVGEDALKVVVKHNDTEVLNNLKATGGLQLGDTTVSAIAANSGKIRYRTDANNSYCEMCMQTGATTYEWVVIKQNTWV